MKWEWKGWKCGEERIYQRSYKRLDRLPSSEILQWGEMSSNSVQRAMEEYEKSGDPSLVKEARYGVLSLLAAVNILEDRSLT